MHIWECKGSVGRSWSTTCIVALEAALGQSLRVTRIRMQAAGLSAPNAYIASVARRDGPHGRWHLHVSDPEGSESSARRTELLHEVLLFYRNFYRPIIEIIATSGDTVDPERISVNNVDFILSGPLATGFRIGLDLRIYELLLNEPRSRYLRPFSALEFPFYLPDSWIREIPAQRYSDAVKELESWINQGYVQPESTDLFVSPEGVAFQEIR
jgi:hypothetical protein